MSSGDPNTKKIKRNRPDKYQYDDKKLVDDVAFNHHPIHYYPKIRELVIKTFGDALRNLSPKRKEKLIQRGVLLWMKGSNAVILNALDAIHYPNKEEEQESGS